MNVRGDVPGAFHLARLLLTWTTNRGDNVADNVDHLQAAMKSKIIRVRPMAAVPGVNEFEIFWLVVCILLGFTSIANVNPPSSIEQSLPSWGVFLWYANLGVGSLIGLVGGLWTRKIIPFVDEEPLRDGLRFYAAGWGYVGTASVLYGSLVLVIFPDRGLTSGLMTLAWGVASIARAIRVVRLIRGKVKGGGKYRD